MHLKGLGNRTQQILHQALEWLKLKTLTLKLYPKNPVWISPDPRILQISPLAPRSATLLPTSF